MKIHNSTALAQYILRTPQNNFDQAKTPKQIEAEQIAAISITQNEKIAHNAIDSILDNWRKLVEKTDYNVNIIQDHLTTKVQLSLKTTGEEIVSMPPRAAEEIANKAKFKTHGLLMDIVV